MALHPDFFDSPHAILDPAVRWFPADEALRETSVAYECILGRRKLAVKVVEIFGNDT